MVTIHKVNTEGRKVYIALRITFIWNGESGRAAHGELLRKVPPPRSGRPRASGVPERVVPGAETAQPAVRMISDKRGTMPRELLKRPGTGGASPSSPDECSVRDG